MDESKQVKRLNNLIAALNELSSRETNAPLSAAERSMLLDAAGVVEFVRDKARDQDLKEHVIEQAKAAVKKMIESGKLNPADGDSKLIIRADQETGAVDVLTSAEARAEVENSDMPDEARNALLEAIAKAEVESDQDDAKKKDGGVPRAPDGSRWQ